MKKLLKQVKAGKITVLHEDWALDWKPENGKKIMNAAITKSGREIDGVVVSNDGTAGGAIQALLEEGLAGKVLVTGQDADLAAHVDAAIAALSDKLRVVVVMHDVEGFTHLEIATALRIPTGTSKGRLADARTKLRAALANHWKDRML